MRDLAKVRNYYIACGYTDLRLGIDGLAAVVTQQYGSHLDSEKKNYVLGKDQLSLFNEAEKEQDHKAEEPNPDTILVSAHERKKKRSQAEMLNHLPEEEVLLEIPEEQRICGKCGGKPCRRVPP